MIRIFVDGKSYEINPKQNLLEACLGHGLDLPYFAGIPRWVRSARAASAPSKSSATKRTPAAAS